MFLPKDSGGQISHAGLSEAEGPWKQEQLESPNPAPEGWGKGPLLVTVAGGFTGSHLLKQANCSPNRPANCQQI